MMKADEINSVWQDAAVQDVIMQLDRLVSDQAHFLPGHDDDVYNVLVETDSLDAKSLCFLILSTANELFHNIELLQAALPPVLQPMLKFLKEENSNIFQDEFDPACVFKLEYEAAARPFFAFMTYLGEKIRDFSYNDSEGLNKALDVYGRTCAEITTYQAWTIVPKTLMQRFVAATLSFLPTTEVDIHDIRKNCRTITEALADKPDPQKAELVASHLEILKSEQRRKIFPQRRMP